MFSSISRFFSGDDVFVSYARADAASYALALANALTAEQLSCFVDQWGTPPGQELPPALHATIVQSSLLVVIGSPAAEHSASIRREVETFVRTGRTIVPIDVDGALRSAAWYPAIQGIATSNESGERFRAAQPSALVIQRIVNAEGFRARNARLRRAFWGTVAAVVMILSLGAVVSWWIVDRANEQLRVADAAKTTAEEGTARALRDQASAELKASAADQRRERAERAARTFEAQADEQRRQAERQQTLARALDSSNRSQLLLRRNPSLIAESVLAAIEAANDAIAVGIRSVELDAALRSALAMLPRVESMNALEPPPERVVLSPNGRHLAFDRGATIEIKTTADFRTVAVADARRPLAGVSNDGRHIVFNDSSGISVVDVATGAVVRQRPAGKDEDLRVAVVSPDLRYAATWHDLWDFERGVRVASLPREFGLATPETMGYGASGRSLVAGGTAVRNGHQFGYAQVWNLPFDASLKGTLSASHLARYTMAQFDTLNVESVAVDPAGERIAVGMDGALTFWRVPAGRQRTEIGRWPVYPIGAVAFVDDSGKVAVVSGNAAYPKSPVTRRRTLAVLESEGHQQVARIQLRGQIAAMAFASTGRLLAIDTAGGLRVWGIEADKSRQSGVRGTRGEGVSNDQIAAYENQPATMLIGGRSVPPHVWRSLGGRLRRATPQDPKDPLVAAATGASIVMVGGRREQSEIESLFTSWPLLRSARESAISHDQRSVGAVERSGEITLRNAVKGSAVRTLKHPATVLTLRFSPRDTYLLGEGWVAERRETVVLLWPVASGKAARIAYPGRVTVLAFSQHERYLAVATDDGLVHVHDVGGREIAQIRHGDTVSAIAFSADEHFVVTGGDDHSARVWDVGTGTELADLRHEQRVTGVDISADGRYIATSSEADGDDFGVDADSFVVRVFFSRLEDLKAEACTRLSPAMEATEPRPAVRARYERACGVRSTPPRSLRLSR